jgi:hypothetical protein
VKQAADRGALNQMAKTTVAVLKMDRAQVIAVELHEVERPQHQVVFDAFVHLPMEHFEPVDVHEPGMAVSAVARCGKRSVQSAPLRV